MNLRSRTLFVFVLLLSGLGLQQAIADTFLLTAVGPGIDAVATLIGAPDESTPGAVDFIQGSGTLNGAPIELYTPSGSPDYFETVSFPSPPYHNPTSWEYDNVGYLSGNNELAVDEYGLLFSGCDDHFNVFAQDENYGYSDDEILYGSSSPLTSVTLTTANTPEPPSVTLICLGVLILICLVRCSASAQ